jgi:RND family efflux transporter MFP subunit
LSVRAKRWSIAAAALVLLAGAVAGVPALKGVAGPASGVPVFEVERGEFIRRVHADGNLRAVAATLLGPPADVSQPLRIAWLAPDGMPVAAGDVVIRFDPSEMEEQLREGRHERATADSRITQQSVRGEGARRNMDRDAQTAALELDYAREFQSKDAAIFSRTEIIESEIDQELAMRKKEHAERTGGTHDELSRAEIDLLVIERRKAELKIQQAEKGLQGLEVRAPHAGIFVLKEWWGRRPEIGQMVWGGNAIAEIPALDAMEAQVFVLEADAGGLEVGLPAAVVLEAHPGREHAAKIKKVSALAQRRHNEVPIQYFEVTLELAATEPERMKPGQRVRAVISLDERHDALSVPRQAVFEKEGRQLVYVRRAGVFEPTEVTLGPAALGRIVIESGLHEGDLVALRDPTRPAEQAPAEQPRRESGPAIG